MPDLGLWAGSEPLQQPYDVAVVIPTTLRPSLVAAVRSVCEQDVRGRIQILVGVDKPTGDPTLIEELFAERPEHVSIFALNLPYSTSRRHGGVHYALDGGSLRTALSYLANSRFVAYLDDDNLYMPDHLRGLLQAIGDKAWAFSHRLVADEETGEVYGPDIWDSLGVNKGRFADAGGFVDPNCMLLNKMQLTYQLPAWSETPGRKPLNLADRVLFNAIKHAPHAENPKATVKYFIRRTHVFHQFMRQGRQDRG